MRDTSPINVLFMASEADPFIKVGGLGDVAGSLPCALRALKDSSATDPADLDVRLVIPYHPALKLDAYSVRLCAEYPVNTKDGEIIARAFYLESDGLPVYLIAGQPIDQETGVYSLDLEADGYKYVFFSIAALLLPKILQWKPDIIHANDWHTSAAVYSLALRRPTDDFYSQTASLLTVHNLPYLGSMTSPGLEAFGLPPAVNSDLPDWAQDMALPLGLLAADAIVAVSPRYSKEILTEDFGSGLHYFLADHREKITGILNGLDTGRWDPSQDEVLDTRYSLNTLSLRSNNKTFLQESLGFEADLHIPLLAMVTRMDPQKGVDIALLAIRHLLESARPNIIPLQAIFLGTGDPLLENAVLQLEQDFPSQVRARILYDERLSRSIYAGADALLMPSRYEPCGLSQMIAMHYGCVPIARATGGLADTIHDPLDSSEPTGFLFKNSKPDGLEKAIQRALLLFSQNPQQWQELRIHGMLQDFSWNRSARQYLEQYKLLLG